MNIYIMSLGQLIRSDQSKSIKAFADILKEQSCIPFALSSIARIYIDLFLDTYWYKTIDKYKLGLIKFDEFRERICNQIGINCTDDEFKSAWNKMCKIDDNSLLDIVKLMKLHQEYDFELIIPSVTNEFQYQYIIDQINYELSENGLTHIDRNSTINIVTSFDNQKLSIVELVELDTEESNFSPKDHRFVSLHHNIRSIDNNKIEYIETNNYRGSRYLDNIKKDLSHTDGLLMGESSESSMDIG